MVSRYGFQTLIQAGQKGHAAPVIDAPIPRETFRMPSAHESRLPFDGKCAHHNIRLLRPVNGLFA